MSARARFFLAAAWSMVPASLVAVGLVIDNCKRWP